MGPMPKPGNQAKSQTCYQIFMLLPNFHLGFCLRVEVIGNSQVKAMGFGEGKQLFQICRLQLRLQIWVLSCFANKCSYCRISLIGSGRGCTPELKRVLSMAVELFSLAEVQIMLFGNRKQISQVGVFKPIPEALVGGKLRNKFSDAVFCHSSGD